MKVPTMTDWWQGLGLEKQIFYGIGIFSFCLLVIETLLTLIGIGGDATDLDMPDIDGPGDHSSGLGLLSWRTITAFLTGFGWAGGIAMSQGLGLLPALGIAVFSGGTLMAAVYLLMVGLMRLQSSGNVAVANAVGNTASVYQRIPAKRAGSGKVEILVQGRLRMIGAFTDADADLVSGTQVKVTGTIGETAVVVEPFNQPASPTPTP